MKGLLTKNLAAALLMALPEDLRPSRAPHYYGNAPRKLRVCRLAAADPDPMTRRAARRKARLLAKGRHSETHLPPTADERGRA
ncbi:hypothetical protein [Roseovarius sp. C03]|uniref:hypothetical protein n=1 Tax=Roseovarius sp. C03 TaxID=3449222 RepID=UPI003EDBCC78